MLFRAMPLLPANGIFKQRIGIDREMQTIGALIFIRARAHIANLDGIAAGIGIRALAPAQIDTIFHRAQKRGEIFRPHQKRNVAFALGNFFRRAIDQPLRRVAARRGINGAARIRMQFLRQRQRRVAIHATRQAALIARRIRGKAHDRYRIECIGQRLFSAGISQRQTRRLFQHRDGIKRLPELFLARCALGELARANQDRCFGIRCVCHDDVPVILSCRNIWSTAPAHHRSRRGFCKKQSAPNDRVFRRQRTG